MFQCGRTQVAQIIKNKDSILALFKANASGSRIHSTKVSRTCEYEDINKAGVTVDSWKERLPELITGYAKEDVWNMDETDSGFGRIGKECKGGKKSKQRITVAFFVSAAGNKEKPIVIWTWCLKRFDKSPCHSRGP